MRAAVKINMALIVTVLWMGKLMYLSPQISLYHDFRCNESVAMAGGMKIFGSVATLIMISSFYILL